MTEPGADARLDAVIGGFESLAIAVSGGVDSMTLAAFSHRRHPNAITMIHAVSPAVPVEGTHRVRQLADQEGWRLIVTGTGEFADPRYRDNPSNRCYFCKTNLYDRIRSLTPHRIASGANLDDLGDYRPGLLAAAERDVVHPYIEARMDKAAVRAMARGLGLADIAELPAQPCLASRVETGIAIDAGDLAFVERVERRLAGEAPRGATLRCRITRAGVVIEVSDVAPDTVAAFERTVAELCLAEGRRFEGVRAYRRGSMFVRT
jgi:uncharacterized protein